MGSFSNYAEKKIIDHILKVASYTPATNLYVALSKSTLTDTATGTTLPGEVSGGSYVRKKCNTWDAANSTTGTSQNTGVITFVTATAGWGTCKTFAIVDKTTKGNVIAYGTLGTAKNVQTGDTAKFATGALSVAVN